MVLKSLKITNFRNYSDIFFELSENINIIYGNNGEGKTNLLESIYYLAITKSHRSFIDSNLIKQNEESFRISALVDKEPIKENYQISYSKSQKQLYIGNKEIKKIGDFVSNIKVIIFYPEDLELIKGAPIERRKYLNIQISQLNRNYIKIINDYEKLLKQRNDLLKKMFKKEIVDDVLFEVITNSLIDMAIKISEYRKNYIDNINLNIKKIFKDISNIDNFNINYINNVLIAADKDQLKDILKDNFKNIKSEEIKFGGTLIGPHRDDFEFLVGDNSLKKFGSQGQQRLAIISLKLSEIPIFKTISGSYPLLLLDDVFSELDIEKRNNLLKYINGSIQTIITTTDLSDIDISILNNSKLIKIESGKIIEEVEHGK